MDKSPQPEILKCRDDKTPIFFKKIDGNIEEELFQKIEGSTCSWLTSNEKFGPKKLRPRIEPWLTALFQSEHLSLLLGSGLSHAIYQMATDSKLPGMNIAKFSQYEDAINAAAKKSANETGREEGNIEDQIRVANELFRGLEIINEKEKGKELKKNLNTTLENFAT